MHAIIGKWTVEETQFSELINGENINTDASKLYPFCLAYPLENELEKLGEAKDWQIEYKWDGIRGQIIKRKDRKSTRLNSSHLKLSRMPSSA